METQEQSTTIPRVSRLPLPKTSLPSKTPSSLLVKKTRNSNPSSAQEPSAVPPDRKAAATTRSRPVPHPTKASAQKDASLEASIVTESQPSNSLLKDPSALEAACQPTPMNNSASQVRSSTARKARPSLSERTVQTISQIPPSPSPQRRRSSFYPTESPTRRSSAVGYGVSRDIGLKQRDTVPLSGFRNAPPIRESKPAARPGASAEATIPPRNVRASSATHQSVPTPGRTGQRSTKLPSSGGPNVKNSAPRRPKSAASHQVKGAWEKHPSKSSTPTVDSLRKPLGNLKSGLTNGTQARTSTKPKQKPEDESHPESSGADTPKGRKSSNALREAIAKAKAARRAAASTKPSDGASNIREDEVNEEINVPTVYDSVEDDGGQPLSRRVEIARTSGHLNISAMALQDIPETVLLMYRTDNLECTNSAWYEAVDLTRFIAANNDLECISEEVFPDVDPRESFGDTNGVSNEFGGLEMLDLHRNRLRCIPVGLRRLERLTRVDLSDNRLTNQCFDVLAQCQSIRYLKLSNNELHEDVDERVTILTNLEFLDVSGNSLTRLPESIVRLCHLRVLRLKGNKLVSLPFEALAQLPITELEVSNNKLSGSLVQPQVGELVKLQVLDVSDNRLTSITELDTLRLPVLQEFNVSHNRISSLPEVGLWNELLIIRACDNILSSLPKGFASLEQLKQADFSGNNLRELDSDVGLMKGLKALNISNNPLRVKKYLSMPTEDLKRDLRQRITPEIDDACLEDVLKTSVSKPGDPPVKEREHESWPVTAGGTLDLSSSGLSILEMEVMDSTAANHDVKDFELHHNMFRSIPETISAIASTLTTLNLAHNKLDGQSYLTESLQFPHLTTLNLSSNTINSLSPLVQHFSVPRLSTLDVSLNRISNLPSLRGVYPGLTALLMSDNKVTEIDAERLEGFKIIDLRNNEIRHLAPKIGLLKGIEVFEVRGNTFKVPRWTILEKGTAATLAWLKDKVPLHERGDETVEEVPEY